MDKTLGLPDYFKTAVPNIYAATQEIFQQMQNLQTYVEKIPTDFISGSNLISALKEIQEVFITLFTQSIAQWQKQHNLKINEFPSMEEVKQYQNELAQIFAKNHQTLLSDTSYQQKFGRLVNSASAFYLEQKQKTAYSSYTESSSFSLPVSFFDTCEREIIWQQDHITLYRYYPKSEQQIKTPLLIIYAFVNRHIILDLQPTRSLIEKLLLQGIPIYLIDWGNPNSADNNYTLDHYLNQCIQQAVKTICDEHQVAKVNLLGVCQGGVLTLCYNALFPKQIQNSITMVTPVDFQTPENILGQLAQYIDANLIAKACGNIPGFWIAQSLLSLRPFRLLQEKYQNLLLGTASSEQLELFKRMEYWMHDCPDHPGALFCEFVKGLYQKNSLIKNQLKIGRRKVNLKNIKNPILNIYAQQDHLVPPSASKCLKDYIGSKDYQEIAFSGGHIGVFTSSAAQQQIPDNIFKWLQKRDGKWLR